MMVFLVAVECLPVVERLETGSMTIKKDSKLIGLLYQVCVDKQCSISETQLDVETWRNIKSSAYFPIPSEIDSLGDMESKSYHLRTARNFISHNKDFEIHLYGLENDDTGELDVLSFDRQKIWLLGLLASSSSYKSEGRTTYVPRVNITMLIYKKSKSSMIFDSFDKNRSLLRKVL